MRSGTSIVFLTPGFTAGEHDTTSMPSLQLYFRYLKDMYPEMDLTVIAFQYPFREGWYTWHGIPVYSAGGKNRKGNRLVTWARVWRRLSEIHRMKEIRIVHAFWLTEATLAGLLFCRMTGIPLLGTAMGQDVKSANRYLKFLRLFRIHTTVISAFQEKFLTGYKKIRPLKIIPFGTNSGYFRESPGERNIDILGAGSLNTLKNYPEFFSVISGIVAEFPGIRCLIAGEGAEEPGIRELIRRKGLEKNLRLAGNLPYPEMIATMLRSRILLHTSLFEGQALVITEALAAGMYVVCHPVGIADGLKSGKLYTGISTDELTKHVLTLLRNRGLQYQPELHITLEDTAANYLELYSRIGRNEP